MSTKISVQKWSVVGELLVSVNSAGTVRDQDWQKFLNTIKGAPIKKYLAASLGTSELTSVQRKQAADLFKERGVRTAVVTDDTMVRGLVTAVGWLGANVNAFSWADVKGALQYLELTGPIADRGLEALSKLRVEVEVVAR